MANITELEAKMLQNIAQNDYTPLNGAVPECCDDCICWADTLADGPNRLSPRQISGLMSQLVQKGLACTDGENVELTPEGYAAYKQALGTVLSADMAGKVP